MFKQLALPGILVVMLASACGGGDDVGLTDNSWQLREIVDENGELGEAVEGSNATLAFEGEEAGGNASCNRYFGPYRLDGDSITFGPLASTLMACAQPLMIQEQAFTAALQSVDAWAIDGETLELSAAGKTLLVFDVISRDLAGSSWKLVAYNNGQGGFTSVILDTEVTADFEEDTVSGSAGCNSYSAGYTTTEDGGIDFAEVAGTERACLDPDGVMDQESRYLEALGLAATYAIEGTDLEMFAEDGLRLLQYSRTG
jgi:heat shock protein HslJ